MSQTWAETGLATISCVLIYRKKYAVAKWKTRVIASELGGKRNGGNYRFSLSVMKC